MRSSGEVCTSSTPHVHKWCRVYTLRVQPKYNKNPYVAAHLESSRNNISSFRHDHILCGLVSQSDGFLHEGLGLSGCNGQMVVLWRWRRGRHLRVREMFSFSQGCTLDGWGSQPPVALFLDLDLSFFLVGVCDCAKGVLYNIRVWEPRSGSILGRNGRTRWFLLVPENKSEGGCSSNSKVLVPRDALSLS